MTIVLTLVSVFTGGILAYVNSVTAEPIRQQKDKTLSEGIKKVLCNDGLSVSSNDTVKKSFDGKEYTFVVHKAVDEQKQPIGAAVESTTQGFGGDLVVLVGFDTDGVIKGYTILQTSETPGLGVKAAEWFQKGGKGNIIGMNPLKNNMTVSKDGGDVDAITASTITSRAFLKAVKQAYQAYINKAVDASSGASRQEHK